MTHNKFSVDRIFNKFKNILENTTFYPGENYKVCFLYFLIFCIQNDLRDRGKNRLSLTGNRIKAAFPPSHSPNYYDGEMRDDDNCEKDEAEDEDKTEGELMEEQ